jgi:SAM-dependent methyltransferase
MRVVREAGDGGEGLCGRVGLISTLVSRSGPTLNLGSKDTRFGDIRADIDRRSRPDLVVDALFLPFKDEAFNQVVFADVIEHLPRDTERIALSEIWRVLRPGGRLLLSTPNRRLTFMLLDPAWYKGHRHYSMKHVLGIMSSCRFSIESAFTSGSIWVALSMFFFSSRYHFDPPNWLKEKVWAEYAQPREDGYVIVVTARK